MLLINMAEKIVCIHFANENKQNTSLMRGLICGLRCKIDPDKAGYSKKVMFIDSHTHNSKNDTIFGRDARFTSLYEDICCGRVRWSEVRLYIVKFTFCNKSNNWVTGLTCWKICTHLPQMIRLTSWLGGRSTLKVSRRKIKTYLCSIIILVMKSFCTILTTMVGFNHFGTCITDLALDSRTPRVISYRLDKLWSHTSSHMV